MNKKIFSLISIICIINLFLFSNFTIGLSNYTYTFEENTFYSAENPYPDEVRNFRNYTTYDYYNASYTFENEVGLIGSDIGWVDLDNYLITTVQNTHEGHDSVLHFNTTGAGGNIRGGSAYSGVTSGYIEFWANNNLTNDVYFLVLGDGSTACVYVRYVSLTQIRLYYDATWATVTIDDGWAHIRIYFDMASDKWSCWINGILELDNQNYVSGNTADSFLRTDLYSADESNIYIDAIGYSWDSFYNLGDNFFPIPETNNTYEVDKWEFFNKESGELSEHGDTDIPFWTEKDSPTISKGIYNDFDDEVGVYCASGDTTHEGIERDFQVEWANVIYVNFSVLYGSVLTESYTIYHDYNIYSYDDTLICQLRSKKITTNPFYLYYYNGATYVELFELNTLKQYFFSLMIYNQSVYLNVTGEYSGNWLLPKLDTSKEGLGEIEVENYLSGSAMMNAMGVIIDSIAVYTENESLSDDYGNWIYDPIVNDFSSYYHSYIELNASGWFSLGIFQSGIISDDFSYFNIQEAEDFTFANYIGIPEVEVSNGRIALTSRYSNSTLYSINIYGIDMTDGTNEYPLELDFNNINTNESYFYIEDSKLKWTIYFNDSNLESINAYIDINNIPSEDYTIYYSSEKDGIGTGYIEPYFFSTYSYNYSIPSTYYQLGYSLASEGQLDSISIHITDLDIYNNGTGSGYISNIRLAWVGSYAINFSSISYLIQALAGLIGILVPSFIISIYAKRKDLFPPLFILFSAIMLFMGIIPLYVFVLIAIGMGGYIIARNSKR